MKTYQPINPNCQCLCHHAAQEEEKGSPRKACRSCCSSPQQLKHPNKKNKQIPLAKKPQRVDSHLSSEQKERIGKLWDRGEKILNRSLLDSSCYTKFHKALQGASSGPYLFNPYQSSLTPHQQVSAQHQLFKLTFINRLFSLPECSTHLTGTTLGQRFIEADFLNDLHILVSWINYTIAANQGGKKNRLLIELLLAFILIKGRYYTQEVLANLSAIQRQLFSRKRRDLSPPTEEETKESDSPNRQKEKNNGVNWQDNPTGYCVTLIKQEQQSLSQLSAKKEFGWIAGFIAHLSAGLSALRQKQMLTQLPAELYSTLNKFVGGNSLQAACHQEQRSLPLSVKLEARNLGRFIVDSKGRLFAAGWNWRGQLGLGQGHERNVATFTEVKVKGLRQGTYFIQRIFVSSYTSFILLTDGRLFAAGENDWGQLGLRHKKDVATFTEVEIEGLLQGAFIQRIFLSRDTTFILLTDGRLFAAGSNKYAQLGLEQVHERNVATFTEVKVKGLFQGASIQRIFLSEQTTFILLTDGCLFATGWNWNGQLGLGHEKNVATFTVVKEQARIHSKYFRKSSWPSRAANLADCIAIDFQKIKTASGETIRVLIARDKKNQVYNIAIAHSKAMH